MHRLNIYMGSPGFDHLDVVYGSEMPIELTVKDYTFGTGATAQAFARKRGSEVIYSLPAVVSGNSITITVPAGAIPAGNVDLQVEVTEAGKKIVTFKVPTVCEGNINDGEIGEVEHAKTAAARAEDAAERAEAAADSVSMFHGVSKDMAESLWAIIQKGAYSEVLSTAEKDAFMSAWKIGQDDRQLVGISADYTGSGELVGTKVTDIAGIEVTGRYSDGTSGMITGWTAMGHDITEGQNYVSVVYKKYIAIVEITGVEAEPIRFWDFTVSANDTVTGSAATTTNSTTIVSSVGLQLRGGTSNCRLKNVLAPNRKIVIKFGTATKAAAWNSAVVNGIIFWVLESAAVTATKGFGWEKKRLQWAFFSQYGTNENGQLVELSGWKYYNGKTNTDVLNNTTLTITIDSNRTCRISVNGVDWGIPVAEQGDEIFPRLATDKTDMVLGSLNASYPAYNSCDIKSVAVYEI